MDDLSPEKQKLAAVKAAVAGAVEASTGLDEAAPGILQAICEQLDWECGALWQVDRRANVLRCTHIRPTPGVARLAFESVNRVLAFGPGVGLPGRVWVSGAPLGVADVANLTTCPRAPIAAAEGLHGAFATPILSGAGEVLGVMEFFTSELRAPSEDLLQVAAELGHEVGRLAVRMPLDEAPVGAGPAASPAPGANEMERRLGERVASLEALNQRLTRELEERTRAEEVLREAHRTWQALVYGSPLAIVGVDTQGAVVIWNQSAARVFGWSEQEVLGRPIPFVPDEKQEEVRNNVRRVMEGQTFTGLETYRRTKQGALIDVSISAGPLRNAQGDVTGAVAVITDITNHKRAERELLKASKLESISLLAGGIAHDFNNILTAIMGNISLARIALDPDSKVSGRLTQAAKACIRAKQLTQQLLTFSRGGTSVKRTMTIAALLAEWVDFALRGSTVRSEFHLPDDLWLVEVDEGQLSQVIYNLAVNAQQAMPAGGRLEVRAHNVVLGTDAGVPLPPGRYVRVSFTDEGAGIPPEYLSKVFDPFFTTKPKSSGLGLTTSYGIVKGHGGHMTVDSQPGAGTTIFVYLPTSPRENAVARGEPEVSLVGRGKILFMDDEAAIRDFATELLARLGYEVECAHDGAQAIQLYHVALQAGRPFDVVILDLTVPGGLGGRDTIRKLQEIDPDVIAVVSSGYSNDTVMAEYKKYGFAGRIAKPYQIEDFSKILHRMIARKKSQFNE